VLKMIVTSTKHHSKNSLTDLEVSGIGARRPPWAHFLLTEWCCGRSTLASHLALDPSANLLGPVNRFGNMFLISVLPMMHTRQIIRKWRKERSARFVFQEHCAVVNCDCLPLTLVCWWHQEMSLTAQHIQCRCAHKHTWFVSSARWSQEHHDLRMSVHLSAQTSTHGGRHGRCEKQEVFHLLGHHSDTSGNCQSHSSPSWWFQCRSSRPFLLSLFRPGWWVPSLRSWSWFQWWWMLLQEFQQQLRQRLQ